MGNQAKLNKSKSLAHHDSVRDKVEDPWDVGYRPQMPATPTWDEYDANIDVQGGKVDDGGELFARSMPRTREVVDMSADEWEYEMEGDRLSWELDSHGMGSEIDASSTSEDALFLDQGLTGKKTPAMALQVWLQGPTIADCQSAMVALMLDALRKKITDEEFNHLCLTSSAKFVITTNPMQTPLAEYLEDIELYNMDPADAKRDEETGNWPGLEPGDMKTSGMTAARIMSEGGGLKTSRVHGTGAQQRQSAGPEGYRIKA